MTDRTLMHNYLKELSVYLSRLDKSDADEVIREIESHIFDAIELQQQNGQEENPQAILNGFGPPRDLAANYVQHILEGAPPPSGFRAMQRVKKGATKTLFYSMGLFGYGMAMILVLLGIAKLFIPDLVGVWTASHGNSIIITFSEHIQPNSEELLGYWLSPLAILLGVVIAKLTSGVMGILKQNLQ